VGRELENTLGRKKGEGVTAVTRVLKEKFKGTLSKEGRKGKLKKGLFETGGGSLNCIPGKR